MSQFQLTDYAYDLLLQRNDPSWLYSVDQGATTIWERWNSYTLSNGFGDANMNSFNHYSYGAVGEWMYRYMAGIEPDETQPGFGHFLLAPQPDRRTVLPSGQSLLTSASATFRSRYGLITSAWQASDRQSLTYDCTVPANTTATLRFPAAQADLLVLESGIPARKAEGITYVGYEDGCLVYELASGTYHFTSDGSIDDSVQSPQATLQSPAETVYDLAGRCVISPMRGIYITGGHKVLVR